MVRTTKGGNAGGGKVSNRVGVIMAGGSGERFWPMSTATRPKQLLRLTSETETMLEEAVSRVTPLFGPGGVYVATTLALKGPIMGSGAVPDSQVFAEPAKRNTLGAFCWTTAQLMATGRSDATVAILTADHLIGDFEVFRRTLATAMDIAEREAAFVTIGIPPDRPETGYGYIEVDTDAARSECEFTAYRAVRFLEKPDLPTAQRFFSSGRFLWNGGMFVFQVSTLLRELDAVQPAAGQIVRRMAEALATGDEAAAVAAFGELPDLSIDYAVMEGAKEMHVVRADFPWDDVGAWDALGRSYAADENGNVLIGDAMAIEGKNNIVWSADPGVKVAVLGLEDVVVVVSDGGVLVCRRDDAQRVRMIPQAIRKISGSQVQSER